ncbi:MAG: cytochrome c biogenesis protein CcsA [Planctomycetota bacterium]
METLSHALSLLLPVLYTLLVIAYARNFLKRRTSLLARRARTLLGGTITLHAAAVVLRGIQVGQCPVGSVGEAFAVVALTIALIYWLLEGFTGDQSTGLFIVSAVLPLELLATLSVADATAPPAAPMGSVVSIHAFAALVGLSAIAVAAAYGLLYLSLYACIKRGRFGLFFSLVAPLEDLSQLNSLAARIALIALTVSIGVGFWSAWAHGFAAFARDPQVILSLVLWGLYAGCVIGGTRFQFGAKRVAYCTVLGLPIVVVIGFVSWAQRGFHG